MPRDRHHLSACYAITNCQLLLQHVKCVAAGGHHTVAVTDTSVCAWGSNSCGQLGTRTFMDKASPTEIKELEGVGVDSVACGAQHTLFLCRYAVFCCLQASLLLRLWHLTCMAPHLYE